MVYTLPHAIKEEKKNGERVGSLESKREQGWQIEKKVKKRNEREVQRGWISCFSFLSKGVPRENILKRRRGRNSS